MGSDISLFVEYRQPGSAVWHCMGSELEMIRDYDLFTLLCDGFRGRTYANALPRRDPPDDLSAWVAGYEYGPYVTWCTVDEFRRVLQLYEFSYFDDFNRDEYHRNRIAILDVAALAARGGNEVRLVYWFD